MSAKLVKPRPESLENYRLCVQYMIENRVQFGRAVEELGLNRTTMYNLRAWVQDKMVSYDNLEISPAEIVELEKLTAWTFEVLFEAEEEAEEPPKKKPGRPKPGWQKRKAEAEAEAKAKAKEEKMKAKEKEKEIVVEVKKPAAVVKKEAPKLICLVGSADDIAKALSNIWG